MARRLQSGRRRGPPSGAPRREPIAMSTGIWSAASGAVAQMTALDVAANNVANAATPGYRADRAVFRQQLNAAVDSAMGTRSMRFSLTRTVEPDRRQGSMVQTGRPLDVALQSPDSWFAVATPKGERYTRAGSIQLGNDGTLRTTEGRYYVDQNKNPIRIFPDATSVSIGSNGAVSVDGIETGVYLRVVQFPKPAGLVKEGTLLVRATPQSGKAEAVAADLETEAIESSNASALDCMTSLVQASREFEMVTRVIDAFSNLEQRTAQEVARSK